MKEINNYRSRFYNLLESTIGDVKPLISEQAEYPKPTPPPVRSNNTIPPSSAGAAQPAQPADPSSRNTPDTPATPDTPHKPTPPIPYSDSTEPTKSGEGYLGTALSVHKVAAGENLTNIAKTYGVTVDQILKSNPQIKNKNMIKVGEIINIER